MSDKYQGTRSVDPDRLKKDTDCSEEGEGRMHALPLADIYSLALRPTVDLFFRSSTKGETNDSFAFTNCACCLRLAILSPHAKLG